MINNPLERELWTQYSSIVGIDEAGRGPIAGPLVVAGCIFEKGYIHPEIDDSKKLTEKKRERLFQVIQEEALWFEIIVVSEKIIDRKNIYKATQDAMLEIALSAPCSYCLSDAMKLPGYTAPYDAVIKGDSKSVSIAAASILAKVTRDHLMMELDALYPSYGFKKHKGYPTKAHLEALDRYGVLDCHRRSYGPVQKRLEIKLF